MMDVTKPLMLSPGPCSGWGGGSALPIAAHDKVLAGETACPTLAALSAIYSPLARILEEPAYYQLPGAIAAQVPSSSSVRFWESESRKRNFNQVPALQLLLRPFGGFGRALQRNQLAFFQTAQDHEVFLIPAADLDRPRDELLPLLDVNGGLALQQKTCPGRYQQRLRLPRAN